MSLRRCRLDGWSPEVVGGVQVRGSLCQWCKSRDQCSWCSSGLTDCPKRWFSKDQGREKHILFSAFISLSGSCLFCTLLLCLDSSLWVFWERSWEQIVLVVRARLFWDMHNSRGLFFISADTGPALAAPTYLDFTF